MLATLSGAPIGSIVLALAFTHDVTGKNYTTPIMAQLSSRVSTAPIFGLFGHQLGHGIVGGILINYERLGTWAGQLVLNILGDTQGSENIPAILNVPPAPMFDWQQLRHWKLSEDDLPEGSIVINKELTLWDFRYYIIGVLIFFLAETALILLLMVQMRRKNAAEGALRQKTEELDQFFSVTLDLLCIALQTPKAIFCA
jgi:hypothetical protein